MAQLSHLYMTNGKNYNFNYLDLCQQADVSHYGDLKAKGNDGSSLTCTNRGKSTKEGSCIKHISVQFSSVSQSCLTLCDPMNRSTSGLPIQQNSRSLLRLVSIKSVRLSSHLILCRPLLLLPPVPPSIRVFSNESALCRRWPKYSSFRFKIRNCLHFID